MNTINPNYYLKIKQLTIILFLFISIVLLLVSCSNKEEVGKENTWTFFEYSYYSGEWITRSDSIQVVSVYDTQGNDHLILVMWQAMNLENEPAEYFFEYRNKYLVTDDGNLYAPTNGENARFVQPNAKTEPLRIGYRIPGSVSLDNLYWGHYDRYSKTMRYKFKLEPEFKDM